GLWIVTERVKMRQVVADGSKGSLFVSPISGEVGFSSRRCRHATKNCRGHRLQLRFLRTDHVNRHAGRLRELSDVFRRYYARVVRPIGKDHYYFSSGELSSVLEGQQKRVVKCRFVAGHGRAHGT